MKAYMEDKVGAGDLLRVISVEFRLNAPGCVFLERAFSEEETRQQFKRIVYNKDQEIEKLRDDIAFLQEFIDKQKRYKEMV
jgi:hypothetical protein